MNAEPRRVLAAGMPGSASTFLYNIVREILALDRRFETLATYSDEWSPRFEGRQHLVLKSHWGIKAFESRVESGRLTAMVTVRHPGDCICSDMERFGYDFDFSLRRVQFSLAFMAALRRAPDTLLFRYEDGFTTSPRTAAMIARVLAIPAGAERLAELGRKYGADAVSAYSEKLDSLPGMRRSNDVAGDLWCPTTQIHRRHIGPMTSGRWRDLPPEQQTAIAEGCGEDAAGFGYEFD